MTVDKDKLTLSKMYTYPKLSKYTGLLGKYPVRAGTTYVGIEIELEKVKTNSINLSTINVVTDGSLKEDGFEFVTIPIQFKYLETELFRLFNGIKTYNLSSRCSTHVHLNVRDFTFEELKTFIILYMIFEKSLYNFSGNREKNNFCIPIYNNPSSVECLFDQIDKIGFLNGWSKYTGLNLCPIYGGNSGSSGSDKIGTIEFRHMVGCTDVEKIINWVNLIVSLKITAKKMSFSELTTHAETMNTTSGYYWLTEETFKGYSKFILNQDSFKSDVESGISLVKRILIKSYNKKPMFYQSVLPLINK